MTRLFGKPITLRTISLERQGIRVNRRLQQFRQISSYIWILVATSLTFTHLAHLQEFDECIGTIEAWVDKYPIPEHLEREACMLLQVLDAQVDSILTDGRKIGKKISQRKLPLRNRFPFHRKCNDILSRTTIPMNTSRNKLIQARWKFLHSIDSMCKSDQTSIAQVMSDEQLDDLLKQPFDKPIFWQNYTQHYPLHGVPNSIPDFLAELHQLDIKSLEAHDYAKNKNHSVYLDDIAEHFQKPPMFSSPLNFLDIRNQIFSRVPVHVNKVDLLRLALRRQAGSAGKSEPLRVLLDYADHEFFLLSSGNSVSTLHVDTAGQLTYIIGVSGHKTWYLPRDFTTKSYEILATFGSSTPETYSDGWVKLDIMPGDLLIMPPGCPHAVFTAEHSLSFGGNFYTLPHIGSSLRVLALQAKFNYVFSNESITEQHYLNFLVMLETCKETMDSHQIASVASSGIGWGITDQHRRQEDVSKISWDGQKFRELQQTLRLLIWDIQTKGFERFD